ncbi:MAG TPA: CBS domain-containing protein [Candidatus Dormibacteraeota bacterium]|nr:CBS domain-containing protein [Candidatus Dormibacteraeota bacterium]
MNAFPRRRHLTVLDVMTTEVITASPFDGFKEVAERLFDTRVSALPVVDENRKVIGVISEADVLVKESAETQSGVHFGKVARRDALKAGAVIAGEAMTTPAITIHANETVVHAARLMHKRGLKHLPVVDSEERLLGMVSRHDLIKVFSRSDDSIKDEVIKGVFGHDLMIDTLGVTVEVQDGVITIAGEIERRSEVPIITFLVAAMDGVVAVHNTLSYRWDDSNIEAVGVAPHGSVAGLF